jgi:Rieske Fe-S protein
MSFLSRRSFLRTSLIATVTTLTAHRVLGRVTGTVSPDGTTGNFLLNLADYPTLVLDYGSVRLQVSSGNNPNVLVARVPGPLYYAVSDKCTHQGCAVATLNVSHLYHCGCHGSEFDPAGAVSRGPATRPLTQYPVVHDTAAQTLSIALPWVADRVGESAAPIAPAFGVYPDPAINDVSIGFTIEQRAAVTIALVNESGVGVLVRGVTLDRGYHVIELPVHHLPAGRYYCEVRGGEGLRAVQPFTVAR